MIGNIILSSTFKLLISCTTISQTQVAGNADLKKNIQPLPTSKGHKVVSGASSGTGTLSLAEQIQPGLILLDLSTPLDGNPFLICEHPIRQWYPLINLPVEISKALFSRYYCRALTSEKNNDQENCRQLQPDTAPSFLTAILLAVVLALILYR